jgi:hypothetical protein
VALKYTLRDIVPNSDSGETFQNSEPSIAVNPVDPTQLVAGIFSSSGSSFFKSTDGGVTWADYGSVPSFDKTIAWKADGSAVLTASITQVTSNTNFTIQTYSGTAADSSFGPSINTTSGAGRDQPWMRTGPSNHVYVGENNDNNASGKTASVLVSTDGGAHYTEVILDRVGGVGDFPSIRLAVNGNTVYSAFTRATSTLDTNSSGETRWNSQVVVVRSDTGGADNFNALGSGGDGVVLATAISGQGVSNGPLGLGRERDGGDVAIAVDPNNAQHVIVAYGNMPGATGSPQVQLIVTESTNAGASWTQKFATSLSSKSALPGLAILQDGAIGLLYGNYDPATDKLSQHFLTTTNDFVTTSDTTLATEKNSGPPFIAFQPALGDFFDLSAIGNTFYGIFCAANADDGTIAQFPTLSLQRSFTGTPGTANFQLTNNGSSVASSIDPFYFSCTLQPPALGGLSNASYTASGAPVTLSLGATVSDLGSTTLTSATIQISAGTFAGDGDMLAASTTGTALTASYNTGNETLRLSGSDTLANYQTVLERVTYSSTSADPTNSDNHPTRTVTWTVNDGGFPSSPQSTTITISLPNSGPNPSPPPGTTGDMILRHGADGLYEIYDIGSNSILAAYRLGQVGTDYKYVGLAGFFGTDTTDMMLRSSTTGSFEVYDISNNNITNAAALGAVGLEFQFGCFGNFNSRGESDMILRNSNNGGLEVYDISSNRITGAAFMGTVGLDWQVSGVSNHGAESDMVLRNSGTGGVEIYDINNNQITGAGFLGAVGLDWQVSGFGDFSTRNEGDMLLRNKNTGGLELYDISNNQITAAFFLGNIGLDWQYAGVAPIHGPGASDLVLRNVNTGQFEVYDIANNQLVGATLLGSAGLDWSLGGFAIDPPDSDGSTSQLVQAMAGFGGGSGAAEGLNPSAASVDSLQQGLLTTPQHA